MPIKTSNVEFDKTLTPGSVHTTTALSLKPLRRLMHFHPHDWMWDVGANIKTEIDNMITFATGWFSDLVFDVVSWPGCCYQSDEWEMWDAASRPNNQHVYDYVKSAAEAVGIKTHIRFPIWFESTYDSLQTPGDLLDEWKMSYYGVSDPDCWDSGWTDGVNLSIEACRDFMIEVWLEDFLNNYADNLPHGIHWNFEPRYDYRNCGDLSVDDFTSVLQAANAIMPSQIEHWGATMTQTLANDLDHWRDPRDWMDIPLDGIKQSGYTVSPASRQVYAIAVDPTKKKVRPGILVDEGQTIQEITDQIAGWLSYGWPEHFAFTYGESGGSPRFSEAERNLWSVLGLVPGKASVSNVAFET
jgi:hypothetical protein